MTALFVPDGDRLVPTAYTSGPWRPDAQHGGPPSAILGRAIEAVVEPDERVARVVIELVRPVPLVALRVVAERQGVSRRVGHAEASIEIADGSDRDGQVVATARGLLLATSEMPAPDHVADESQPLIGADAVVVAPDWSAAPETICYHRDAVEHRPVSGGFGSPGPADQWIRLARPLIDGEETSPLCRVLAAADFGSGISAIFDFQAGLGLINADITVSLHRPLIGEWVRLQSVTRIGPDGIGMCTTTLADEGGPFGAALQSLLAVRP